MSEKYGNGTRRYYEDYLSGRPVNETRWLDDSDELVITLEEDQEDVSEEPKRWGKIMIEAARILLLGLLAYLLPFLAGYKVTSLMKSAPNDTNNTHSKSESQLSSPQDLQEPTEKN